MQYVYVLATDEKDLFLEQALLSITSLRLKIKNVDVTVLIDDISVNTLINARVEIYNAAKITALKLPENLNKEQRSRWLKTSMRQHIKGDFLYIDCDTIVADDLFDISDNIIIAAVPDQHIMVENHPLKKRFYSIDKKLGFSSSIKTNKHFNSGVIFCRDVPLAYDFFDEWRKLWLLSVSRGVNVDQPSFNQANLNINNIITELDGIWNCQVEYNGLRYLDNAKIIHYFSSNKQEKPYLLANTSTLEAIKNTGRVSQDIKDRLRNPRSLFSQNVRLISDARMLAIINSSLFDLLIRRGFNKNNESPFIMVIDSIINGIRTIHRKLHNMFLLLHAK
jgi:lipopolysaccharide biosynthesis glycosyltransferase